MIVSFNDTRRDVRSYSEIEDVLRVLLITGYRGEIHISTTLGAHKIPYFIPYDRLQVADRLIEASWDDNDFNNSRTEE